MFKKVIRHKNNAAKISTGLCLASGAGLYILAGSGLVAIPLLAQAVSILLLSASIYIAVAFLLREYTYSVDPNTHIVEDDDLSKQYDLIVTEAKGKKQVKVCHIEMSDVSFVREITPDNKKTVMAERKNMKRYTYDTRFAPNRQIEIRANIDGEDYSIILSYDEEFLAVLQRFY